MTDAKTILGHTFVPMTDEDWMAFAGAEPGSLICYCADGKTVLVYDPGDEMVIEMTTDENGETETHHWAMS